MMKILQSHEKIPLISLVMNPESFSQSVENMFDLSFLVADGHVGIERSDDNLFIRIVLGSHPIFFSFFYRCTPGPREP
jgi:hypothetical protein